MNLKGKHIIVTGGGSGVGAQTARQFVEAGADVTIMGRTEPVSYTHLTLPTTD